MKCPSCGSENIIRSSEKNFPVLYMTGRVAYCADCKLMWSTERE